MGNIVNPLCVINTKEHSSPWCFIRTAVHSWLSLCQHHDQSMGTLSLGLIHCRSTFLFVVTQFTIQRLLQILHMTWQHSCHGMCKICCNINWIWVTTNQIFIHFELWGGNFWWDQLLVLFEAVKPHSIRGSRLGNIRKCLSIQYCHIIPSPTYSNRQYIAHPGCQ